MIKIYCHNVRVWTRDTKGDDWCWKDGMKRIRDVIIANKPDVLCLQELSYPANLFVPKDYRRAGFSASHPIYVRKGIKTRRHRFHFRWESCEVMLGNEWVLVVNVHLHWNQDIFARNMGEINKHILPYTDIGKPVILCGDWNNPWAKVWPAFVDDVWKVACDESTFEHKDTKRTANIDQFYTNYPGEAEVEIVQSDKPLSDHKPLMLTI